MESDAAKDLEELEKLPMADRAAALNELVDQLEEELERTGTSDRQGVDEP